MENENEIVKTGKLATPEVSVMDIVSQAIQTGMQPEQLREVFELQRQFKADQAKEQYTLAVNGFQSECPIIPKIKKGNKNHYAPYDFIHSVIREYLNKYSIVISFEFGRTDKPGAMDVTCIISHGTHSERRSYPDIPIPKLEGGGNATQGYGAMMTYAKRYALCAALNIVDSNVDTDGVMSEGDPPKDTITDAQLKTIRELLDELFKLDPDATERAKKYILVKYKCESPGDLPSESFAWVKGQLNKKLDELKGGEL